jgi:hypothetical protein
VKGSYKLTSHDKASLAIYVTGSSHSGKSHPKLPEQTITVERGEGHFTLRFQMWEEGNPHVSFYPISGGESFASAYF